MSGGPRFVASGTVSHSASTASITPALPTPSSLVNTHGLLLSIVLVKNNETITTATPGWTKLYQDNSGVLLTVAAFIAPGGSAAPVFTWTSSVAASAVTAFYDDTGQPVVTNAVGATSVNTGISNTPGTAGFNTTRNESVVVYYSGLAANTGVGTPAPWTENYDNGSATSASTLVSGSREIAVSGTSSGSTAATAGTSTDWVHRQMELLVRLMPANFYSVEFEVSAHTALGSGFATAEFEVSPLSLISSGFASAEFEVAALTFEGEEPVPPTPEPEITKVRAWQFPLDGHDLYVLRIGENSTAVFDLTTGEQTFWESPARTVWRAQTGTVWLGRTSDNLVATNIIAGDDTLGLLWSLDPEQPYDEAEELGQPDVAFERVLTTVLPLRMRNTIPCDAVYLTVSTGEPLTGEEEFTLRTSDDNGRTWRSHGTVTMTAGNYEQEVAWRSLGLMKAPGRIFEITDSGAATRVSNFDIKFRGMQNA
jgi:hypothetical protein